MARLGLIRRWIVAPDRCAELIGRAGLDQADLDLVGGDATAAAAGYHARIVADGTDLDAWTGLGLALIQRTRALVDRPEWVCAVYAALKSEGTSVSPTDIALWQP
jgi:hypothetical protein